MKKLMLSFIAIGLSSQIQAEKSIQQEPLFTSEEKLAPLDIFKSQHVELFSNEQAPVSCVSYCRALKNQCDLTYSYSYCIQEFGNCMDECLDPPGGGSGGGSGGGNEPQEPVQP